MYLYIYMLTYLRPLHVECEEGVLQLREALLLQPRRLLRREGREPLCVGVVSCHWRGLMYL